MTHGYEGRVRYLAAAVLILAGLAGTGACSFHPSIGSTDDGGVDPVDPNDAEKPDEDIDLDGVLDGADNCPMVANPDQHDEDEDALGDECDACPHIAGSNADTDADGLPDACDPHPLTIGDRLLSFESFKTTGDLPPDWVIGVGTAGHWTVSGDALNGAIGSTREILFHETGLTRHAIDIGFTVALGAAVDQQFVSALTDGRLDLSEFNGCGIRLDATPFRELLGFKVGDVPPFTSLDNDATEPPAPGNFRIFHVHQFMTQACSIPSATLVHKLNGTLLSKANTMVGIRVRNVTVTIRYVAVFTFN